MLVPGFIREFLRCKILRPLLRLLRGGVTPRRLAWSLALGIVIGINPSVGITSLVVVMLAWAFGLSQVASQIGAHAVTPFHLLMFVPFIELGVHLFHTSGPTTEPAPDRASEPSSLASVSRDLAVGMARADRVVHSGCDRDATARWLYSTSPGAPDAPPPDAATFAFCNALVGPLETGWLKRSSCAPLFFAYYFASDVTSGPGKPSC